MLHAAARVSSDTQQMQNRYTEIKNSHQLGRAPDTRIVENLRASCYDPPMARLRELIEPGGFVAFQDGKYRQGYRRMQEFDHGQLLVHSYGKQGIFKNHFDQNSQAVALWSIGHSAVFTCCFSDQCERHGSVDRQSCPHCHEFKFESGDVLVFNASYDQQIGVCHGVKEILDEFDIPVVFVTAFPERLLTGEKAEPAFLVTKPFEPDVLKITVAQALFARQSQPGGGA